MTRARPMPPDERRRALIDATRPLLLLDGPNLSTRRIAEAAGVAEGTIFRVFDSKDDLIHACVADAITDDGLDRALSALPPDAGLRATVEESVRVLGARVAEIRTLISLLHHQSPPPSPRPRSNDADDDPSKCERPSPDEVRARNIAALASAIDPYADELRTSPRLAAVTLFAMVFGANHGSTHDPELADAAVIADLLLHGLAKDA